MKEVTMKKGDIVNLKSGGPPMTLVSDGDYSSQGPKGLCKWFDGSEIKQDVFSLDSLEIYSKNKKEYKKASLTVDIVILTEMLGIEHVLLIKRKNNPFKDHWAIPGGFLDIPEEQSKGETLREAAYRELQEETSLTPPDLKGVTLKQFKTYSDPDRDPRDRVISIVFYAIVPFSEKLMDSVKAGSDAKKSKWFPLDPLTKDLKLAFDHEKILKDIVLGLIIGKI